MSKFSVKKLNTTGTGNRFRFQSFAESVSQIEIDEILAQPSIKEDCESGSFFFDRLEALKEQNLSADFADFCYDVKKFSGSLALILFNKEVIVEALVSRLGKDSYSANDFSSCCLRYYKD